MNSDVKFFNSFSIVEVGAKITMATDKDTNNELPAVSNFREYLRFKSVHPTPDYGKAAICAMFVIRIFHSDFCLCLSLKDTKGGVY